MFDQIAKQLELQSLSKNKSFIKITIEEYEEFCKGFLFEQIKGDKNLGTCFCEKYNVHNHVLMILSNESAKKHIKQFYVK